MSRYWKILMMFPLMLLLSGCFSGSEAKTPEIVPSKIISAERFERIQTKKELVLGIAASPLAPLENEIIQAVWSGSGRTIRKVEAPAELLTAFLRSGRVDIICGAFTDREIRSGFLEPCLPFLNLSFFFVQHREWKESAGETVLLYPNSPPESIYVSEVRNDWKKIPESRAVLMEKLNAEPTKTVLFLSSTGLDRNLGKEILIQKAELPQPSGAFCFALRRNDTLLAEILEERFHALQKSGTIQSILEKYPWTKPL